MMQTKSIPRPAQPAERPTGRRRKCVKPQACLRHDEPSARSARPALEGNKE